MSFITVLEVACSGFSFIILPQKVNFQHVIHTITHQGVYAQSLDGFIYYCNKHFRMKLERVGMIIHP